MDGIKIFKPLSLIVSALMASSGALAQMDPTATLLLRSRPQSARESDFESNRYTVRPSPSRAVTPEEGREALPTPTKTVIKAEPAQVQVSTIEPVTPAPSPVPPPASTTAPATNGESGKAEGEKRDLTAQMRDLLLGGSEETLEEYRNQLDARDVRKNILEISAATGYLYSNSSSSSWYRNHYTAGPALQVDARFWISPFLGFQSSYLTSLSHEMRGNPRGTRFIPVTHQSYDVGLRFRRYFGVTRKSPGFTFGVDYREYRLDVPADDANRPRLRTSGVRLSGELFVPVSARDVWEGGAEILPRANHEEIRTGLLVRSGKNPTTDAVGLWFGRRYLLDRGNQVFWRVQHRVEKNIFSGSANLTDPVRNTTLSGVSVTSGLTLIQLGYTWGD